MLIVAWFVGCAGSPTATDTDKESDGRDTPTDTDTDTDTVETIETGASGVTGDTGGTVVDVCTNLPPGPFSFTASNAVHTEEDFDFNVDGLLVYQSYSDLAGIDHFGNVQLVAASIGFDVAGIRSLPTSDYIVAQQDTNAVRRVNHVTGNTVTIFSGLNYPNGLEVERSGMAYVSEYAANGAVRRFDPYTGDNEVIVQIENPNGLALSPDEQTLYIATSDQLFFGDGRVAAIDRDPVSGEWLPTPREVYQAGDLLDAITVDECGNLYVTEYQSGKVIRLHTDGTVEPLVDLPNSGFEGYGSARFGAGFGGWDRTTLYVSNRTDLYGIEIGVEGRHVLAP